MSQRLEDNILKMTVLPKPVNKSNSKPIKISPIH